MYSKCQRLFRSPSMPCGVIRPILKRLERPQDRDLPVQSKRRRSVTPLEEQQEAEEPVRALLLGGAATFPGCSASPSQLGNGQGGPSQAGHGGAASPLTLAAICLTESPCPPLQVLVSQRD